MIKSMTAYTRQEASADDVSVTVEARGYNSRHLDLSLRLTHGYHALEERIKKQVATSVARGRLEMNIQIVHKSDDAIAYEVDLPKAKAYLKAAEALRDALGLSDPVHLEQILNVGGIVRPAEVAHDPEHFWPCVSACLANALADLDQMRIREGAFLAKDFDARLTTIETRLKRIRADAQQLPVACRDRLKERLAVLTEGLVEIEPDRLLQEAAILAEKSDISEEIVRAESHLQQFRELMERDEPAGRKLNFLLQELNREFNTMGAKMARLDAARHIVEVKAELEKIREQVQNVE
ncbi:MAG: YicC/YloC family endoribonuclease [Desulfosarcinaceae bacterium]|nr:YicC/YloC family endoribonuclease [Desulfosarcinaceae bacterium]